MRTQIIITMAGFGRRFLDAGYNKPKYMIEVHGRSLFQWSMLSLVNFMRQTHFTFVVRKADDAAEFIVSEFLSLDLARSMGLCVREIEAPTDGQATTALVGEVFDPSAPMLIYNIDTFVHPDALPADAMRGDGWIPCFPGEGDAWSFAAADADGRVSEVREKQRISPHATVGLYGFGSFDLYERTYRRHYADKSQLEMGEAYVAPMYNTLIAEGGEVFIHHVPKDAVIPLGTPAEVERFAAGPAPRV